MESIFAEFPRILMRHEAIEMVCAHVPQSQEPPPPCGGVLCRSFSPKIQYEYMQLEMRMQKRRNALCFRYDWNPLYWTHNKGQQSSRLSTTYGTSMRKGTVPFVLELRSMTFYLWTTLPRKICDGPGHIYLYNRTAFLLTFLKFSAVICFSLIRHEGIFSKYLRRRL